MTSGLIICCCCRSYCVRRQCRSHHSIDHLILAQKENIILNMENAPESHPLTPPRPRRRRCRAHPPWNPQATKLQNGSALIAGVKQSGGYVRRLKELIARYRDELPHASPSALSLIKRAAVLEAELERLETQFAKAGASSQRGLELYTRMTGNLRRVLRELGLQRRDETKPNGRNHDSPLEGRTWGKVLVADWEQQQREEHAKKQAARAAGAEKESIDGDAS